MPEPPFLMSEPITQHGKILAESLSGIPGDLQRAMIEEFKTGALKEMVESKVNHQKIAKFNHDNSLRSIDGIGRLRMSIDPWHFHNYGQRYGYDCWKDKGFLKDVEKVHPELKAKCGGTKIQVGYNGENKRSSQKYNL